MTLREARCKFSSALASLILQAEALGYEIALDEGMERLTAKDPTSDHMPGSLHHSGLAQDVLLYLNGEYLTRTEDYTALGEFWEGLGKTLNLPLAWGGRFTHKDGNHFSLTWGGKS